MKETVESLLQKWTTELPKGNTNGRSGIGYIREFLTDLALLAPAKETPNWKLIAMKILRCFAYCEGSWYQHEWSSFDISQDEEKQIVAAFKETFPLDA